MSRGIGMGGAGARGVQRRRLSRSAVRITALAAVLALSGCAAEVPAPEPAAPTPTFLPGYVEPPATLLAPLTGATGTESSPDALRLAGPALSAKIDNHSAARPQLGLERADLVIEQLVEGGLTRYVAVWHSDVPEEVGPVRSIRPMDPDIVAPFGGVVAYSGGQDPFVASMQATDVVNAVHGTPDTEATFLRTLARSAPHNVLVRAEELLARHQGLAAPAQQFAFAADTASSTAAKEGAPTARIDLDFGGGVSRPSWSWDAAAGRFLRSQAGVADVDASGAQLGASNVLVVRVPVTHDLGVPKTELIGSGPASVSSGGATVPAAWSKDSATAAIRVVDSHGFVVRLAPGNTWIELVPVEGAAELVAPPVE